MEAVARDLATHRDELNRLDGVAGDGDLGLTAATAAAALLELAPSLDSMPEEEAIRRCGRELATRAPSTGGTLLAFALMAAGKAEVGSEARPTARAAAYLRAAADTIAARGKAAPGDRTMLDALLPAVEALERGATLREAADAAAAGAAATAAMEPTVGRAAWLADRARGHEDAGARLIAMAFEAAARETTLGA
ncbi:MAG: DAK2 domain-containing protein [Chloroflexi bacterium]|nr:DAK2 domain-containing protein [Chloroflexota bacterium]